MYVATYRFVLPHLANGRVKTSMTLLGCISSSTDTSVYSLYVPMNWCQGLASHHFYLYQVILKWSSQFWVWVSYLIHPLIRNLGCPYFSYWPYPGCLVIILDMNHHLIGLHSNIIQSLLHWYTHRGDHRYWSFWVPGSLYAACYSLPCEATYKYHRGGCYHWNRFICIHILFCEYNHWQIVRSFFCHCWVCWQGHLCWIIFHIIFPPRFCGFVLSLHYITL